MCLYYFTFECFVIQGGPTHIITDAGVWSDLRGISHGMPANLAVTRVPEPSKGSALSTPVRPYTCEIHFRFVTSGTMRK